MERSYVSVLVSPEKVLASLSITTRFLVNEPFDEYSPSPLSLLAELQKQRVTITMPSISVCRNCDYQ